MAKRPLVSCLMVTRGDVRLVSLSLLCFLQQDYANRELVIVTDNISAELRALVQPHEDKAVRLEEAPHGLTLGDLRNFATARAKGEIICQWDDDDIYDPARLSAAVLGLINSKAAAIFLSRWTMWWPARRLLVLSQERTWEGTICIWRHQHGCYPALKRAEDSAYVELLKRRAPTALLNMPHLYCYVVTGQNTWNNAHFEMLFSRASQSFTGDAYDIALGKLATRMPIAAYAEMLEVKDVAPALAGVE